MHIDSTWIYNQGKKRLNSFCLKLHCTCALYFLCNRTKISFIWYRYLYLCKEDNFGGLIWWKRIRQYQQQSPGLQLWMWLKWCLSECHVVFMMTLWWGVLMTLHSLERILLVFPTLHLKLTLKLLMISIGSCGMPYDRTIFQRLSLLMLSKAFLKSIKLIRI